jgi:hypothetical protein
VATHPIERFRKQLRDCDCYPDDVVRVAEYIGGTAAFPAGAGLYRAGYDDPLPDFPYRGVMVLANNPDSYVKFIERLKARNPHGGPDDPTDYWKAMYPFLVTAGVDRSQCFFTNAYPAFILGESSEGKTSQDRAFRRWRQTFVAGQIQEMMPSVVAVLGSEARTFARALSPAFDGWVRRKEPPTAIDGEIAGHQTQVVALLHPAGWSRNRHRRGYGSQEECHAREAELLRAAVEGAVRSARASEEMTRQRLEPRT